MSKKIKTDYFSHDREKSKQPNIYYIIKTFGTIYYAYFWLITEKLYSLENYQIDLNNEDQLFCLVEELQLKNSNELKEIINIFVSKNVLSKKGDFIRSMDVDLQIKELEEKAERNRRNRTKDKDKQLNDNNDNSQTKPIETEKPITKEEKDTKDIKSPYYCNPRYKKTREALESLIQEKFEIIPEFHMIKSNMQKSALKNLFDLINVGIIDITSPIKVSNWLEDRFDEILSMRKKKPFYLSELNNLIVDLIRDQNFRILNDNCYTNFKKDDFIFIHSNEDGYFGTNDNKFKLRVDIEEPVKPTIEITDEDDSKNPFKINDDEMIPLDDELPF